MDEIQLNTITWQAPEYVHKEHGNDWFWTIGVITVVACGVTVWLHSYVFSVFLLLSGASLIMFTMRPPVDTDYVIETKGLTMGKDAYEWKSIKSFNIKKKDTEPYAKLLIETSKYFLPVYTIPLPKDMVEEIKQTLLKVIPRSEIDESKSMAFAEKLGF